MVDAAVRATAKLPNVVSDFDREAVVQIARHHEHLERRTRLIVRGGGDHLGDVGGRIVADDSASRLRALMALPSLEDVFSQLAVHEDVEGIATQLVVERTLLKRQCTAQDIAGAIVFLCADNSMITAQTLVVDGGYSL